MVVVEEEEDDDTRDHTTQTDLQTETYIKMTEKQGPPLRKQRNGCSRVMITCRCDGQEECLRKKQEFTKCFSVMICK